MRPLRVANYTEWLEALAASGTPEASAAALSVAELLKKQISPFDFDEVKSARIVLTSSGELVTPDRNRLFIGGQPDVADTAQVDERLVDGSFAERVLRETFGVADVDRSAELAAYVTTRTDDPDYWPTVWSRIDELPADQAKDVLLRRYLPGEVRVRTLAGSFQPLNSVLLAGPIVDATGSDPEFTVDEQWHSRVSRTAQRTRRFRCSSTGSRRFRPRARGVVRDVLGLRSRRDSVERRECSRRRGSGV